MTSYTSALSGVLTHFRDTFNRYFRAHTQLRERRAYAHVVKTMFHRSAVACVTFCEVIDIHTPPPPPHTNTHARAHTHASARAHTHVTHTHTHTHTHTQVITHDPSMFKSFVLTCPERSVRSAFVKILLIVINECAEHRVLDNEYVRQLLRAVVECTASALQHSEVTPPSPTHSRNQPQKNIL